MWRNYSKRRTCSGKKTMKSCNVLQNLDKMVIIDVDSDGFDNVIIIDVPDSSKRKLSGSSVLGEGKRISLEGVISIDDDESDNVDNPKVNAEGSGDVGGDGTSSKSSPASDCIWKSVAVDADDCWVPQRQPPAFKLSRCKKTCNDKVPSRNRYGLNSESESDSSESSSSDCEVMEGSFCEQWEKAFPKRNSDGRNGQYEDQVSPQSSYRGTRPNVETEDMPKQNFEPPVFSNTENGNYIHSSYFSAIGCGFVGGASFNARMANPAATSDQKAEKENFPWWWSSESHESPFSSMKPDVQFRRETDMGDCMNYDKNQGACGSGTSFENERKRPQGPSLFASQEDGNMYLHRRTDSKDGEQNTMKEHMFPNFDLIFGFDNWQASVVDVEAHSGSQRTVSSREKNEILTPASPCFSGSQRRSAGSMEKQKLVSGEKFVSNAQSSGETVVEDVVASSEGKVTNVPEESSVARTPSWSTVGIGREKAGHQDADEKDSCDRLGTSSWEKAKEPIDSMPSFNHFYESDPLDAPSSDIKWDSERDIINKREKLKETDEYKRAAEEEWAARQRELQIQAEEVQRLRKRRKAESLRILDMEKRQKLRVAEVRETQKKDEENLNMKERLRCEIRKELYRLEIASLDMASLLHGLGIQVGGGFHPSSHEVNAAYKRALLKFHPDRASRTDIRQQVEAEEKFKLITRMREKLLTISGH